MEGVVNFVVGDKSNVKMFSFNKFIELGSGTKMTGYSCSGPAPLLPNEVVYLCFGV